MSFPIHLWLELLEADFKCRHWFENLPVAALEKRRPSVPLHNRHGDNLRAGEQGRRRPASLVGGQPKGKRREQGKKNHKTWRKNKGTLKFFL